MSTEALTVLTKDDPGLMALHNEIHELECLATGLPTRLETDDQVRDANDCRGMLQKALRQVEDLRKDAKAPILTAGRMIDGLFAPLLERGEKARKGVDLKILDHARRQEEARKKAEEARRREAEEAARKAEEEAKRAGLDARKAAQAAEAAREQVEAAAPPPPPMPRAIRSGAGTTSLRKEWDFEIEDFAKLPDAFKEPNLGAIRKAVNGGARAIEGLRIFPKTGLATRVG